jgi:uncharacterized protein (TIGR02453 family)
MSRSKTPTKPSKAKTTKKPVRAQVAATKSGFTGFPTDALAFLRELERNNDRAWFEARRDRYESAVRAPALAFIAAMAPELAKISKHFVADPRPVGGSLMRIHRDVRFSADKSPYKTNIGIQFRHVAGKDVHAPGIYFHVEPGRCFVGAGLWHPEPDALAGIRKRIVAKAKDWQRIRDDAKFAKQWKPSGESLSRPPKGFDPEHVHNDDLKRKDHNAVGDLAVSELGRADLPKRLAERLASARDFLAFLCAATAQPF